MYWIDINDEWQDRNFIDRLIDRLRGEALQFWYAGRYATYDAICGEIADLEAERAHPFTLDIIF